MAKKRDTKPAPKHAAKHAPLVAGSGQAWKVTLGIGGMAVAAAASLLQLVGPDVVKQPAIGVAIVTGFLGIATLLTIRCPGCDLTLAVWAFQNGSLTTWHERLVELKACPTCGLAVPERE